MGPLPAARIVLAATAAAFALGGCYGTPSSGGGPLVHVSERDFHITAPTTLHSGTVTIRDQNRGPERHELIVVRTATDKLPLRADGLTVDEDAIHRETVGTVETVTPGATGETQLHLRPGRYLMFCNMSGHFRGGMHTVLVVS